MTMRHVQTGLPAAVLGWLERAWPTRRRFGVVRLVFSEAAEQTELLEHIEKTMTIELAKFLGEQDGAAIIVTGSVWTRWPGQADMFSKNREVPALEQQPEEVPWSRGEPVSPRDRLICRISGEMLEPLDIGRHP